MQCYRRTMEGKPCGIPADRVEKNGKPVCHVHDPAGVFQQQQSKRWAADQTPTPGWKMGKPIPKADT